MQFSICASREPDARYSPCMQMPSKIPLWEYAATKRRAKLHRGCIGRYRQNRLEGIEPNSLSAELKRAALNRADHRSSVVVYSATGNLVPSTKLRQLELKGVLEPEPFNKQARLCTVVQSIIAKRGVPVEPPGERAAAGSLVQVRATAVDAHHDRAMEDWSCEVALQQLEQQKGKLYRVLRTPLRTDFTDAGPLQLAVVKLERGRQRASPLDFARVFSFKLPSPTWAEEFFKALSPLRNAGKKFFADFHMKHHLADPRRHEVSHVAVTKLCLWPAGRACSCVIAFPPSPGCVHGAGLVWISRREPGADGLNRQRRPASTQGVEVEAWAAHHG